MTDWSSRLDNHPDLHPLVAKLWKCHWEDCLFTAAMPRSPLYPFEILLLLPRPMKLDWPASSPPNCRPPFSKNIVPNNSPCFTRRNIATAPTRPIVTPKRRFKKSFVAKSPRQPLNNSTTAMFHPFPKSRLLLLLRRVTKSGSLDSKLQSGCVGRMPRVCDWRESKELGPMQ